MKGNLFVPACQKYIKTRDGSLDIQRIYSVTKSAYLNKFANQILDDKKLFSFLQSNSIIPSATKLDDINAEHIELCFSIISQYKCNSICQLCAYSPLFKNQFETEESLLIGYALSSWSNLQNLLSRGVTCRHFRAMISISEKSSISVIPLNRLAFEYLEKIPKSKEDMIFIADKITEALKQNNKDKLSAADFRKINIYLTNLCDSKYGNLNIDQINSTLKNCFKLKLNAETGAEENIKTTLPPKTKTASSTLNSPPSITASQKEVSLEGLLAGKPASIPQTKKETSSQKKATLTHKKKKEVTAQEAAPITDPSLLQKDNPKHTVKTVGETPAVIANTKSFYTKSTKASTKATSDDEVLKRKPVFWQIAQQERIPIVNLETVEPFIFENFLNYLLITPLLPMEIISENADEKILVYVRNRFYSFSNKNLTILDRILPYITKSSFRKIICYEPYMLYSFFREQDISSTSIFSIRIAADAIIEYLPLWSMSPGKVTASICGVANKNHYQEILYVMQYYQKLYMELTRRLDYLTFDLKKQYLENRRLCEIIGLSFQLDRYTKSSPSKYLFTNESLKGIHFNYNMQIPIKNPYLAVRYHITITENDEISEFPLIDLLFAFAENRLLYIHDLGLLSYSKNTLILAVHVNEYSFLCDTINNLGLFYAEKYAILPIYIDEKIIAGKIAGDPPV